MGGPGSGRHGQQGRKLGGTNSAASCAAMREGMIAAYAIKATKPSSCQECGSKATKGNPLEWFRRTQTDGTKRRKWICPNCLNSKMEPLRLEDFTHSGVTNLGAAQKYEVGTGHAHGPDGDRALARRKTR